MDASLFDTLTRFLAIESPRRLVLGGIAALGIRLTAGAPHLAVAKKRKKKLKRNAFGCVNVGGKCRGNDANCCSGICQGKKPKKGKKDKSRCVAHDESTCVAGLVEDGCGGTVDTLCTTSTGQPGVCNTTTGNAGYCQAFGGGAPTPGCTKDADCRERCGTAAAACVVCEGFAVCAGPSAGDCKP